MPTARGPSGFVNLVLGAGALLALSAEVASAQPARVNSSVNLRGGPGTTYPIIATIAAGSTVEVANCSGEWCTVHWRGRPGYVIARNLGTGGAGPVAGGPRPAVGVVPAPAYYAPGPVVIGPPPYYWGPGYYWGPRFGWHRPWR